jgi:8-oxo-dGTP pyrophosphatase MutT (NUDIX family)
MADRLTLIPAVYIFLEKEGKFLLMRRANTGYQDGKYQTPSGHVEEKETPKEAVVREAREELGITIDPNDLEFVHVTYRMREDKTGYRVDIFFRATVWKGEASNAEPEKCDDLLWAHPDSLPENTVQLIKTVLEHRKEGSYLSEVTY